MAGRKNPPSGNEETAAILRQLESAGIASPQGGGSVGEVDFRAQARELLAAAKMADAKAAQAKQTRQLDLANNFAAKAAQFRRRAQEIMALNKL